LTESDESEKSDEEDAPFSDESDEEEAAPPKKRKKGKQNVQKSKRDCSKSQQKVDSDLQTTEISQNSKTKEKKTFESKGNKESKSRDETVRKNWKENNAKMKGSLEKKDSCCKSELKSNVKNGKKGFEAKLDKKSAAETVDDVSKPETEDRKGKCKEGEHSTRGDKPFEKGTAERAISDEGGSEDCKMKKKSAKDKENSGEVNQMRDVGEMKKGDLERLKQTFEEMCDDKKCGEKSEKLKKSRRKSAGDALSVSISKKQKTEMSDIRESADTAVKATSDVEKETVSLKAKKRRSLGALTEMSKSDKSPMSDVAEPMYVKIKKRVSGEPSDRTGTSKVKVVTPRSSKKDSAPMSAYAKMIENKDAVQDTPSSDLKKKGVNLDSSSTEKSPKPSWADAVTPTSTSVLKKWEKARRDTPARSDSLLKIKKSKSKSPVHEFDFLTPTDGGKKNNLSRTPVVTPRRSKSKTPLMNIAEEGSPDVASENKVEKNLFAVFEKVKTPPAVFVKKAIVKATPKGKQNEVSTKCMVYPSLGCWSWATIDQCSPHGVGEGGLPILVASPHSQAICSYIDPIYDLYRTCIENGRCRIFIDPI
jgi:hypothetical protein